VSGTAIAASKKGRPRSAQIETLIRDAVLDLVSGGHTLSALSLVSIARTAGISRNSIYRRWGSKEELFADVVRSMKHEWSVPESQSARENIGALTETYQRDAGQSDRRMEEAIEAERQNFPDLYDQLVADVRAPFDHAMKLAVRRGKETREIRGDVDEYLLCNVLRELVHRGISSNLPERAESASMSRRTIDLIFDGVSSK
jgi:AcrR family transcriptional regulator